MVVGTTHGRRLMQAVAAGARHSLALSSGGSVFSFGWGVCGQRGHGRQGGVLVGGSLVAVMNRHLEHWR